MHCILDMSRYRYIVHNSRTSHYVDMKLAPVSKFDKRDTAMSKKFEYDVILINFDVIVFFSNLWSFCSHSEAVFWTYGLLNSHFH